MGMELDHNAVIEARNLIKTYEGDATVLTGVSLTIVKGESVAIVGKSGSGKSTLMHILATLDRATSGELIIDGRSTDDMKQRDIDALRNKKFGFVFQQFFVNGRDTCLENVTLPLTIMGVPKSERTQRGTEMLTSIGLEDKIGAKASELSGGQKQRLCIGRALITRPEVIFADEPTGNLDSENSANVMKILLQLQRERGITLILVTHDDDLAALCDRTITMKDGQII
jgi:putative ABC transport system ATP-binding protein